MADFLDATNSAPEPPAITPEPVTYRKFGDIDGQRKLIYSHALQGVRARFPIENDTHRIELVDADYSGEFNPTKADEKKALLEGNRLQRPIKGKVRLVDKATNQVLDEKQATLAHVPHLNSRGLFIHDGVPYAIRNQARLRPGVYVRRQQNGGTEAHFNIKPGTGRGFRVNLDPETGVFNLQVEQSKTRLYPLLKSLGVQDDVLKAAWGDELFKSNWREISGHDQQDLRKVVQKLGRKAEREVPDHELSKAFQGILERSRVDPDVTELTLGARHDKPNADVLTHATKKIIRVANDQEDSDNRDSQAFQSIHSAEDLIRERLERDQHGAMRKLLWGATKSGKLDKLYSGLLTPNIHALYRTGLTQTVEDINPIEIHDQHQAVTRMGEGGIGSTQSVSRSARGVQSSYLGLIDGIRAPESNRIGLDMRVTDSALKGSDGQLYTTLRNPTTGESHIMSARQMTQHAIAFPGEMQKPDRKVRAMVNGKIQFIDRTKVQFELPDSTGMFSRASNMVPLLEGVKSQRALMGARMLTQALPLRDAEAPLVHSTDHEGKSFYEQMGGAAGAVSSEGAGRVLKVTPDGIDVLHEGGEQKHYQLYDHYPMARKTMLYNTPVVRPGEVVQPGQLLAHSNFTDKKGHAAPGKNMRVAYLAGEGLTYDDSIAISESAAKKLSSEHQYKHTLDLGKEIHSTKTQDYRAIYGDKYKKEQYEKLDEDGVVRPGQTINPGDPVVVGIGKRQGRAIGALTDTPKSIYTDVSQTWDHPQPGVVTDVSRTKSGIKVTVKSYEPMSVGSKLSGVYGNKGVVSKIIPDDQMPHSEDGRPAEILMAPTGIITRINPSSLVATLLGKIAEKRGQPYHLKAFSTQEGLADFALNEAKAHGVKETETLTDPRNGRKIPNVFTGSQYILKLHHTAESKMSARDIGGYSADESPSRGGDTGSKRIGLLDIHSLLAAGATEFLKDAKLVRGQRNDAFWRQLKTGQTPEAPGKSFANGHFLDLLRSAGVNIKTKADGKQQLGFMTDKDVDALAQHEVNTPDTFDFKTMKPIPGGLFDLGKTGGAEGTRFTKIQLPTKIPNPMAEEPIVRILGLTGKKFESILSGQEQLNGKSGPQAIEEALKGIDLDREIERSKQTIRTSSRTQRDDAVRKLGYLQGLKNQEIQPADLMISKMPVLPPKHRPIMRDRHIDMVHDANYLYKDLMESAKNYQEAGKELGDSNEEYLTLYKAAKAVAGLTDPVNPKTAEQGVRGMLRFAIGVKDSPKFSRFQRKVLGNTVDTIGRSVITIDPELDMDQVGIPEDMAWRLFRPFVIRRLVREGTPAAEAVKAVRDRSPAAENHLKEEMKARPVIYNRAPSLHRFNYVAGHARMNKDSSISIPQAVTKGLNADFDGDAINVHLPVSDKAIQEAKDKLFPSKNLLHPGSFDVHLLPSQEYLAGLYLASKADKARPVRMFASKEDVLKAYKRGEISVRDPVRILEK